MKIIPDDLQYTEGHLWLKKEEEYLYLAGVTYYIPYILSDILFVDLPDLNMEVRHDERVGFLESSLDIYNLLSPVTGRIVEVNRSLEDTPELINRSPYKDGWIFRVEILSIFEVEELIDAEKYEDMVASI